MIPPEAIVQFSDAQKRLLRRTYDQAWQTGVGAYQPDQDPDQEPATPRHIAEAGLSGAALLALRRTYSYVAPTSPDPVRRAVALAPSFNGVNSMVGELSSLAPVLDQSAGAVDAFAAALEQWAADNAWRLDGGDSVAWAGSEAGFAEAANVDGQLLTWSDTGDDHECESCISLASMDPMPLADWPSSPGDGSTECDVGCRCEWSEAGNVLPGDVYTPNLTDGQQATIGKLMDAQASTMAAMMPDAQYLD